MAASEHVLVWKFGGSSGSVDVPDGVDVILGRGTPAAVTDVRTSRRQVLVRRNGGRVTVRALGLNPAIVQPDTYMMRQDAEPVVLNVGDTVCLLCDGTYPFTLQKKPAAAAAQAPPAAVWQWRADDGWKDYAPAVCERVEEAWRQKKDRVDIDTERFVDLKMLLQRRKDDPSKRREVRRFRPPTSAVPSAPAHPPKVLQVQKPKPHPATTGAAAGGVGPLSKCVVHFLDKDEYAENAALCRQAEQLGARMTPTVKDVTHFVVSQRCAESNSRVSALVVTYQEAGTAPVVTPDWLRASVSKHLLCDAAPYAVNMQNYGQPPAKMARTDASSSTSASAPSASDGKGSGKGVRWFWKRDDGGWEPYAPAVASKIEAAYNNMDATRVVIDKQRYIDLLCMKQRHHISEDLERDVKREVW